MELVILDRDGVINEDSDAYIKSPDEWLPIPGSLEAIAQLTQSGARVVVATNQSGIARGLFTIDTLLAIHDKMLRNVSDAGGHIDAIFFCPHGPNDGCSCRKPLPGLYQQIAERLDVSLAGVPAIGDAYRDLAAARAVGADPILVRSGKGERTLAAGKNLAGVRVFADLAEAVETLLAESAC
jgi:D-glycero-D-manno-heptose 1,7-bisphosphate phosphatase